MTGAPMPFGADAVCIQEEASEDGTGGVAIPGAIALGRNVRFPGEDISAGSQVFAAGTELGAAHLGVLAAIGERTVVVHRQPVVGVLSTGDELVGDGAPLGEGKIRDANRPALLAMVARSGARAVDLGIVGDDSSELLGVLERATASCDAVVVSGGASNGDRDPIASVLEKLAGSSAGALVSSGRYPAVEAVRVRRGWRAVHPRCSGAAREIRSRRARRASEAPSPGPLYECASPSHLRACGATYPSRNRRRRVRAAPGTARCTTCVRPPLRTEQACCTFGRRKDRGRTCS